MKKVLKIGLIVIGVIVLVLFVMFVTTPVPDYKTSIDLPQETVMEYINYTLGTLPTAEVDYDKAKLLLDSELQVQFEDSMFVPVSYGIQDGPDKVEIISTDVDGDYAEVEVAGYWGESVGRNWLFLMDKFSGKWLITHVSFEE